MNIAAVEQVPLVVVATNNHYAYSTPNDREFACDDLMERAIGYGFEGYSLDGTDLAACLDVIGGAVKRARAGRPPQLVVASVLRLSGHGEHDDASYVSEEMKQQPFARDCLKVAEQTIIESNLLDPDTLADMAQRRRRAGGRGSCRRSKRSRAGSRQRRLVRVIHARPRRPRRTRNDEARISNVEGNPNVK